MRSNLKNKCPVCQSDQLTKILQKEKMPVHQNLVFKSRSAARGIAKGDVHLVVCDKCEFVFNQVFDFNKLSYGKNYDNSQGFSKAFSKHTDTLLKRILNKYKNKNICVVEVGCGKGTFLKELLNSRGGETFKGFGFDPSYEGSEKAQSGRLKFYKEYYGPNYANIKADVIICRHVIEHVPDPVDLLQTIKNTLKNSPTAKVYFETPCISWIFKNQVIWDIFYEHCSYFNSRSITRAFKQAGYCVDIVRHVFGGQYLWVEAQPVREKINFENVPNKIMAVAKKYGEKSKDWIEQWKKKIKKLKKEGNVVLWGAGAKGVTFSNLVDKKMGLIDYVVDINKNKQGNFVPGTGHPIVDIKALRNKLNNIIVMNPNYIEEIDNLLANNKIFYNLIY